MKEQNVSSHKLHKGIRAIRNLRLYISLFLENRGHQLKMKQNRIFNSPPTPAPATHAPGRKMLGDCQSTQFFIVQGSLWRESISNTGDTGFNQVRIAQCEKNSCTDSKDHFVAL